MDLIDVFKSAGILSIKIARHRTFWSFFIPYFSTVIPSVYTEIIFASVSTNGYCESIFNRKNLMQSTDTNAK